MAGLFGGKSGKPLTPAQQAFQQNAQESATNYYNKYLPVQSFFNRQVQTDSPGLQEQARGQAASTARTAGKATTDALLSRDTSSGARAGSGRYLTDMQKGGDLTAAGVGSGLADATAGSQRRYVQALQTGLRLAQKDQDIAMQGLNTAAQAQEQEAGVTTAGDAASRQGAGQLIGLAAAL